MALFPAFWGNFWFTAWRIFIGSFIQGIKGLDAEAFTYNVTPHIQPWYFYLRFFYNQLSEVVIIGIILAIYLLIKNKGKSLKKNMPIIIIPFFLFFVHQIATKKGDRFMLYTFPFLILYTAIAYNKVLTKINLLYGFIILVTVLRVFQFKEIFPDFLAYKNPLSIDSKYIPSYSVGYWKLAKYIEFEYGEDHKIHLGDSEKIRLFYPGKVSNFDNKTCSDSFDLVIQTRKFQEESCFLKILKLDDTFTPYGGITFYIYKAY